MKSMSPCSEGPWLAMASDEDSPTVHFHISSMGSLIRRAPRHLASRRGRSLVTGVALLLSASFFLWFSDGFYPIEHWVFFRYLRAWASVVALLGSSFVAGWWLLAKILRAPIRLAERVLLSTAIGVFAFYSLLFLLGIGQLYSRAAFYTTPLLLFGLGAPKTLEDVRRIWRRIRPIGLRPLQPRNLVETLAAALIGISLVALYMHVLLPRNLHADAHWYHVPVAEHYVAAGGIVRFPEGWYVGVYPQLASILYVWALLSPGDLFSHVVLCLHIDFALFLVTVFGVAVLSAKVLRVRRLPAAAAAVFLFPSIFIYDSNINGSADHVLAFWAAPLAVALLRLTRQFSSREAVLAGLLTSATAVTKYQGCYFVVPALLVVLALSVRHRRGRPLLAWLATAFVMTASHWLKNLVYYHDPLYPLLHAYLPSRPFHEGASLTFHAAYWDSRWLAVGPWPVKLWSAFKVLFTYSFVPNDFDWHGARPTFGSLLTLLLPVLVLAKVPRRLWLLVLATHLGIAIWYLTSHQDRYLQALLPWMAASVAGLLATAWLGGTAARVGVGFLVGVQVLLGLDVYFIRTHIMIGDSVIRAVSSMLSDGHNKKYTERYVVTATFEKLGAILGPETILLQHNVMARLGLGVRVVADGTGWQGGIEYLHHETPNATAALMRSYGVNKAVRYGDPAALSPAEAAREAVFLRWLHAYGGTDRVVDEAKLTSIKERAVDEGLAAEPTRIAWLDCQGDKWLGLFTPPGLALGQPLERAERGLPEVLDRWVGAANVIIVRDACGESGDWISRISSTFSRRMAAGPHSVWIRTSRR